MTLSEEIRNAINGSGKSVYRIAKDCRLDERSLGRFLRGEVGLALKSLESLAKYLGLGLTQQNGGKTL